MSNQSLIIEREESSEYQNFLPYQYNVLPENISQSSVSLKLGAGKM
jgi:hypothetical protein